MQTRTSPILESLPSSEMVRQRLVEIDQEAATLKKLLRVLLRKERAAASESRTAEGGVDAA